MLGSDGLKKIDDFFKTHCIFKSSQVEFFIGKKHKSGKFCTKKSKYIPICKSLTSNQLANHWEATVGQQFFS